MSYAPYINNHLFRLALTCMVSLLMSALLTASALANEVTKYQVVVNGPLASLDESCADPCHLEQIRPLGRTSATVEETRSEFESSKLNSDPGVRCAGNCISGKQKSGLSMSMPTELREGVEVSIEEGVARFVFYRVTETESGKKTLKQHSRFEVDRDLISLKLRDHDIRITRTGDAGG